MLCAPGRLIPASKQRREQPVLMVVFARRNPGGGQRAAALGHQASIASAPEAPDVSSLGGGGSGWVDPARPGHAPGALGEPAFLASRSSFPTGESEVRGGGEGKWFPGQTLNQIFTLAANIRASVDSWTFLSLFLSVYCIFASVVKVSPWSGRYFPDEKGFWEVLESFPETLQKWQKVCELLLWKQRLKLCPCCKRTEHLHSVQRLDSVKDCFYSLIKNFIQDFVGRSCARSWEVLKFYIYSNRSTNNCGTGHNDLVRKWIKTLFFFFLLNLVIEPFLCY